jgi:hypothetical protein
MNKTVEDFEKTWEEQIAEIEKRPIDSRGTYKIYANFSLNRGRLQLGLKLTMTEEEFYETVPELDNLESKVKVALETSRSKYSLQKLGVSARIVESIAVLISSITDCLNRILTNRR